MTLHYSELSCLSSYYLEDSYVLDIVTSSDVISFRMDLVLTPEHPRYHDPGLSEQHCYAIGTLIFRQVTSVQWISRNFRTSKDAAGEEDLGNIDNMKKEDSYWRLEGDWGEVVIHTETDPTVELD